MSLSDGNRELSANADGLTPYQMESFDASGQQRFEDTGQHIFEPYHDEQPEKPYRFDCVVPSDGKCAEEIVAESEEIIAKAKKRADEIEREAYEKGFNQGEKDGFEFGGKKLDTVLNRIEAVLREMERHKEGLIQKNEGEILDLIGRVARRVVRGAVRADSEVVRRTILEAFNLISEPSEVTIKVNEEDLEYVKELRPEFFKRVEGLASVVMESDPAVNRGGCVLEAISGSVDARLEKQLDKILQVVAENYDPVSIGSGEASS